MGKKERNVWSTLVGLIYNVEDCMIRSKRSKKQTVVVVFCVCVVVVVLYSCLLKLSFTANWFSAKCSVRLDPKKWTSARICCIWSIQLTASWRTLLRRQCYVGKMLFQICSNEKKRRKKTRIRRRRRKACQEMMFGKMLNEYHWHEKRGRCD